MMPPSEKVTAIADSSRDAMTATRCSGISQSERKFAKKSSCYRLPRQRRFPRSVVTPCRVAAPETRTADRLHDELEPHCRCTGERRSDHHTNDALQEGENQRRGRHRWPAAMMWRIHARPWGPSDRAARSGVLGVPSVMPNENFTRFPTPKWDDGAVRNVTVNNNAGNMGRWRLGSVGTSTLMMRLMHF